MKVLLINGSPHEHGCTYTALKETADTLEGLGIGTEILYLGTKALSGCIACGKCREAGVCVFNDIVRETSERIGDFDALVVGSPVYYAGPTSQLTAFMDRLFYSSSAKLALKARALSRAEGAARRPRSIGSTSILRWPTCLSSLHSTGTRYTVLPRRT